MDDEMKEIQDAIAERGYLLFQAEIFRKTRISDGLIKEAMKKGKVVGGKCVDFGDGVLLPVEIKYEKEEKKKPKRQRRMTNNEKRTI